MVLEVLVAGLLPFLFILPLFFITSFTGGFAGAIVAGGRENRSIWANGGIGLVGWSFAWVAWRLVGGSWPEEISIGLGVLALLASMVFVSMLERRMARYAIDSEHSPAA